MWTYSRWLANAFGVPPSHPRVSGAQVWLAMDILAYPCRHRRHLDITPSEHHDARMRTTLTLDSDVALRLEREMKRSGLGLKAAVNQALRVGLGMTDKPIEPRPFRVESHDFGFRPGTDLDRLNQLADELEAEETSKKLGR